MHETLLIRWQVEKWETECLTRTEREPALYNSNNNNNNKNKTRKPHCVKSVQIRSYFWSVFSGIRIEYRDLVNLRIQSEYRKIRTRNNSVFGHFSRSTRFLGTKILFEMLPKMLPGRITSVTKWKWKIELLQRRNATV